MDTHVQPVQQLNEQPHRSYKTPLILMCFLTLSLAALTTVLVSQNTKPKVQTPHPTIVQSSPAPILPTSIPFQSVDTSNWKTYEDPVYHYSFNYPPEWTLKSAQNGSTLLQSFSPEKQPVGSGILPPSVIQIEFSVFSNPNQLNAQQWRNRNTNSYDPIVKQELPIINGVRVVKSTWQSGIVTVDIVDHEKVYSILGPANSIYLTEFNQILQTFKFTP